MAVELAARKSLREEGGLFAVGTTNPYLFIDTIVVRPTPAKDAVARIEVILMITLFGDVGATNWQRRMEKRNGNEAKYSAR